MSPGSGEDGAGYVYMVRCAGGQLYTRLDK